LGLFKKKNNAAYGGVKVNILDSMCGMSVEDMLFEDSLSNSNSYRIETWEIEDIGKELYQQWVDPLTKELYLLIMYKEGEAESHFTTKDLWERAYQLTLIIDDE